jgi:hypothetical protein
MMKTAIAIYPTLSVVSESVCAVASAAQAAGAAINSSVTISKKRFIGISS